MRFAQLRDGRLVPVLGQGTCGMGAHADLRRGEISALRRGLELGLTLVDTAEIYADGGAERLVSEALTGLRSDVFLVSKVTPENATKDRIGDACRATLKRLRTEYLDLYLLHWRGHTPLNEVLDGFLSLQAQGLIRGYGVSNLDPAGLAEFLALDRAGAMAVDQVLYNLMVRGVELDLLPLCAERGVIVMAYSPFHKGTLEVNDVLVTVARQRGLTPFQVALAWLLAQPGIITIPKAASVLHVYENRAALDVVLDPAEMAALDEAFPRPGGPVALRML
jgi:diketogulonate reductase-like aldo/keto reductase